MFSLTSSHFKFDNVREFKDDNQILKIFTYIITICHLIQYSVKVAEIKKNHFSRTINPDGTNSIDKQT
jgi:hypothetical protein